MESDSENSAKPLNVTLLASEWGSSMGGLSTINRELAIQLAKHNLVTVTFLVPKSKCLEEEKRDAESYNIAIREVPPLPGFDDPLDWLRNPPKDLTIDIIVGHGAKLGKHAQLIEMSHGCKWVQVVHTAPEELGAFKNYAGARSRGEEKNRAEVDLCTRSDLVVTVGPKLREVYSSYLRFCKKHKDTFQLTPGIFQEFSMLEQATREEGKFKVLTLGRGDSEDFSLKGYDIAAEAVVELKDNSYCLVFVGAPIGKQDEVAQNLLRTGIGKDQLIVREFVQSKKRLKELFCEVDLAIMPSRTEGFGLTALEALSAGVPILVSGNSGFAHVLRDLPSGESFLVNSDDPKTWAKAIAAVRRKRRSQRLQDVQALRTSYKEKYNWEEQCGDLVDKMWSMVQGNIFACFVPSVTQE